MDKRRKVDWYLIAILVLSAFLFGWGIWDAGSANGYYTAAITSMTKSWHNFIYGAFDPAGFITVDKPPVALWFMAISAKIFGVHGWSVVLPSVLAGIGSTFLMYKILTPKFGAWTGRIAALVFTITPTVVANERTNNMDAILVFFLLLAVYVLTRAVYKKNIWLVMVSFGLIGVSFNIKMLQAFMILPGMLVFYWLATKVNWKKRLAWLTAGMASLAVFTLALPMAVDAVPASQRPYIGSSQTNSLMELAFGYNGAERLLGQSTGTGGAFPGMGNKNKSSKTSKSGQNGQPTPPTQNGKNATANKGQMPAGGPGQANGRAGGPGQMGEGQMGGRPGGMMNGKKGKGGMGGAGGAFAIGNAGPFRLFQDDLGSQIGWFLPLSIIGMFAGYFVFRKRGNKWYQVSDEQSEVLLWAGWLVPIYGFFSVAGFFHPYYTIMLAPAIAALTAIGVVAVKRLLGQKDSMGSVVGKALISLGLVSTTALQAYYAWDYYPALGIALVVIAVLLSAWWWLPNQKFTKLRSILSALVVAVLAGWWALTPTLAHNSAQIPFAGPSLLQSGKGNGGGMMSSKVDTDLLNYLEKHQGNAKYMAAATNTNPADSYIIKSGRSIMALGGFNGTDPTMTLAQFKHLVKTGQVRYFIAGGMGMGKSSTGQIGKISTWVQKYGKQVNYNGKKSTTTSTTSQQGGPGQQSTTLYDLSGTVK
ncbi:PMT family glycosyltransferase ArnT/Agl22 [Eupransor demetentiae]|uniref:Involved in glycosylation of proteins and lipid IVA (ArnT) n=2 Tax=Eupransor demetentiae TaxID=3109584 RepID=A0ABP0EP20_9LACO|nr:PMT family glycosyltransferase ArnT/Agl22 [Lactobacillaceae bacterium LMG 33000]